MTDKFIDEIPERECPACKKKYIGQWDLCDDCARKQAESMEEYMKPVGNRRR